jgi:hypothetical protein
MLRSILRQIICSPLPDSVEKLWSDHYSCHTEPPVSELLDVLKDLIAVYERVSLVFEALDEYPEHQSPGRSTLLDTIEDIRTSSQAGLHLIVTSRREPDIRKALQPVACFSVSVDQALESDVEKFVDHALGQEPIRRWGPELSYLATQKLLHSEERYVCSDETILDMTKQINRRFRWTALQVERLRTCPAADDFRNALQTLPKSLEETYHRALETIPDIYQERMRRVLMWLTSSLRELTSSEVAAVIAFPFVEDVLRICTSVLITVIDGDTRETIKLAHFTVKEFLIIREGSEVGLSWYRFSAPLANRCVTAQVVESVFGCPPAESTNLVGYASQFWPAHARRIDELPDSAACGDVQSKINSLLEVDNRRHLLDWLKRQVPGQVGSTKGTNALLHPVYYASLLGLKRSVIHFWKDYYTKSHQALDFYGNALDAAACMGHAEVVVWLIDHIENPSSYLNFALIVRHLRMNLPQTLRALLQNVPKPSVSTKVMSALTVNPMGEEILDILLKENLASIHLTEELVCAAAHNKWNRKIIEFLVRKHTREFPVSFWALLTVAGTSHSALQLLINSRRGDIHLKEQDYLDLAKEKSVYTIQKLVSLGVAIPITTTLIKTLAGSPLGSQILKLLLDTQIIEYPLTSSDVLTVAGGFNLETFDSLLRHRWEDNTLTEALVFAIASNCFLDPPVRGTISKREMCAEDLLHRDNRPTLKHSTLRSSSEALMSLIDRKELTIELDKNIIALITDQFEKGVILHLVNRIAGTRIFTADASHNLFSSLLRRHISDSDVSLTVLQALGDSYNAISTSPLTAQERFFKFEAATRSNRIRKDITIPKNGYHPAVVWGFESLPKALQGLKYSESEYDDKSTVYVQPGWRVPMDIHSAHERAPSEEPLSRNCDEVRACGSPEEISRGTFSEASYFEDHPWRLEEPSSHTSSFAQQSVSRCYYCFRTFASKHELRSALNCFNPNLNAY